MEKVKLKQIFEALSLEEADAKLAHGSSVSTSAKTISHVAELPSNVPCEDISINGTFHYLGDRQKEWRYNVILDGHGGRQTANALKAPLPAKVGDRLFYSGAMNRPYTPNDKETIAILKNAFLEIDQEIHDEASEAINDSTFSYEEAVSRLSKVSSGTCALFSMYDPTNKVVRVASTGDSRAVLGEWDEQSSRYIPVHLSRDDTGFNQKEVDRIDEEHPGENAIKSGRVHGRLAVTRSLGDHRYKWEDSDIQLAHEKFRSPAPLSNNVNKTSPYLTAQPHVREVQLRPNLKPSFFILASDGLWDRISSEDAVTLVERWLERYHPADYIARSRKAASEPQHSPLAGGIKKEDGKDPEVYIDRGEARQI